MNVYAKDTLRKIMLLWLAASGEGRGVVFDLFEGERGLCWDGTSQVKPEMLKTSATCRLIFACGKRLFSLDSVISNNRMNVPI